MTRSRLRWGILGAANVARKNWRAMQLAGNATLTAVASRDPQRARDFVSECQAEIPFPEPPAALPSYEALVHSPNVDAVYCPLPTGVRKEWVLAAAAAGKHVICEKPCAASASDLHEMIQACQRHDVQFMDGVMFAHSLRTARMLEVIADGTSVGEVRRLSTQFSFLAEPDFAATNIRGQAALEPQGCAGDLGWYCIRLALMVFKDQRPIRVTARSHTPRADQAAQPIAPAELSGELLFPGGATASFYCSFRAGLQQWAHISGTHGSIYIPDYVLPHAGPELHFEVAQPEFHVRGCEFRMDPNVRVHTVAEHSHGAPAAQEANLFRNFSAQALSGRLNPEWPEMAMKTQQILDACLESASHDGCPEPVPG